MNRHSLKRTCQYLCFTILLPPIILSRLYPLGLGNFFFHTFATGLSMIPGKIGSYLRVAFYRGAIGNIDWDVNIGFGSFFTKRNMKIEKNVSIGAYCIIGSVKIKRGTQIASRVSIPSGRHQHSDNYSSIEINTKENFRTLIIGSDSWIGESSVILSNVGTKCIVGAGSVVIKDVKDRHVVAGNPAHIIRGNNAN